MDRNRLTIHGLPSPTASIQSQWTRDGITICNKWSFGDTRVSGLEMGLPESAEAVYQMDISFDFVLGGVLAIGDGIGLVGSKSPAYEHHFSV